jgi:hypothetical protein
MRIRLTEPCGCHYTRAEDVTDRIQYCPLHAAAERMRVIVQIVAQTEGDNPLGRSARAILREIGGV